MPFLTPMTRGGAPDNLAPEVACARPGRGVVIDYDKADAWSCGLMLYGALCAGVGEGGHTTPFPRTDPRLFRDADYRDPPAAAGCVDLWPMLRGLLTVDPAARLSTAAALTGLTDWRPLADRVWALEQQVQALPGLPRILQLSGVRAAGLGIRLGAWRGHRLPFGLAQTQLRRDDLPTGWS